MIINKYDKKAPGDDPAGCTESYGCEAGREVEK